MIAMADLKKSIKPLSLTALSFLLFSLLFIAVYVLCSYQSYLKAYSSRQAQEIIEVRQETEGIVKNIVKFLELTEARIRAAQGESKRIQAILSSTDLLSSQVHLPSIQKFSYHQNFPSENLITRFGIMAVVKEHPKIKKKSGFNLIDNTIFVLRPIFTDQGLVLGYLELQITPKDFLKFLKSYKTVMLGINQEEKAPDELLAIIPIKPETLWEFFYQHKLHYTIFGLNLVMFLILLGIGAYHLNRYNKKQYQEQIGQLEQENARLGMIEQEYETHHHSCQAFKNFYASFERQERDQIANIAKSLTVLEKSVNDPDFHLTEFEYLSILRSCRHNAEALGQGALGPIRKELIDLEQLLEEIWLFFDERIQKSEIAIVSHCDQSLNLVGDPIFLKFILLNLIGKALQRVPKAGQVSVSAFEENHATCIEICDNGFSMVVSAEKLVKKTHEFALSDDVLYKTCQEYGLRYEQTKSKGGTHKSLLIIPGNTAELEQDNVVQLFK